MGISQAELGAHFGITSQAVSQWENNPDKGPQRDRMPKLAKVLQVTLEWLTDSGADPEADLVTMIRALSPAQKRRAVRLIKALAEDNEEAA